MKRNLVNMFIIVCSSLFDSIDTEECEKTADPEVQRMRDGLSSGKEKQNEDSDTESEVWGGNRENKEGQGRKNGQSVDGDKESQGKKKT